MRFLSLNNKEVSKNFERVTLSKEQKDWNEIIYYAKERRITEDYVNRNNLTSRDVISIDNLFKYLAKNRKFVPGYSKEKLKIVKDNVEKLLNAQEWQEELINIGIDSDTYERAKEILEEHLPKKLLGTVLTEKFAKILQAEKRITEYKTKRIKDKSFDIEDFEGKIEFAEKELEKVIPIEDVLTRVEKLENMHELIVNNGGNFNISEEELELAISSAKAEIVESFNYKDFSNLFAGQINQQDFAVLAQSFKDNGNDIRQALVDSGSYTQSQINDIVKVWDALNAQTGDMYTQLLAGIGDEINSIYVQEAEMKVENALGDTDANSAVKQDIKKAYANLKESTYKETYENRSKAKGDAWLAVGANFGATMNGQAAPNLSYDSSALFENTEKAAQNKAEEVADAFLKSIEKELEDGKNVEAINDFYDGLGGKTLAQLDGVIEGTENLTGELAKLAAEAEKVAREEFTDFQEKINNIKPTVNGENVAEALNTSTEKLSMDQLKRLKAIYAEQGDDAGIAFHNALAKAQKKGLDSTKINKLLDMDLTSIDSVIEKFNAAGLSIEKDKAILEGFIEAMGGADALLFDDIAQGAERLQSRIDKLVASLEKISKLAAGEGDLAGLAAIAQQLQQTGKLADSADVKAFNDSVSWGDKGIKYNQPRAYTPIDAQIGFKIRPINTMLIDVYGGYAYTINGCNMMAIVDTVTPSVIDYSLTQSNYQLWKVGASLHYHYRDFVNVNVKGNYYAWKNMSLGRFA